MNDKDLMLTVEINYKDQKFSISKKNHFKLEEITQKCIKNFNIDKKDDKNIHLYYIDDEGDMINIETIEDIYISSKEEPNSENLFSKIYLDIYSDDNSKIKELEETIEKMKKEHIEELNKIKSENNKINLNQIEKIIKEIFDKEKNNFLEEIKSIKNEIKSEIKEKTNNDTTKNEKYEKIKTNINNINKNLNDNTNQINNINDEIKNIKEQMNKMEINKEENNVIYQNMNNQINEVNNNIKDFPQYMKMDLIPYKCINCKNIYFLNKCFDAKEDKHYNEHSLKITNLDNNQNINNDNNNKNYENVENKKEEKFEIIDDYINENNKTEIKEKKIIVKKKKNIFKTIRKKTYNNKIENRNLKTNEEKKEEEKNELISNLCDYFYDENNKLKNYGGFQEKKQSKKNEDNENEEFEEIKKFYKEILKNKNIQYIEEIQNNFFNNIIDPALEKLKENDKTKLHINNRKYHLQNLIKELSGSKK